jgi:hypothetical protein
MVIFSTTRPGIPERHIGVETAGQLLVTAGDNPATAPAYFRRSFPSRRVAMNMATVPNTAR